MTKITAGLALAVVCTLAAGPALAHHPPSSLGTVRITQPVIAGGTTLQPGAYEVRDAGDHVAPLPGQSPDAQSVIEFVRDGMVVARDVAEVMPGRTGAVGTSGSAGRLSVQMLKGGDFVRIAADHDGERYLIHLPVAAN